MPVPPTIPRRVTLPTTLSFVHDPIGGLMKYEAAYGENYYIYLGGLMKTLISTDPILVQHVLQKNHRNYEKSTLQTETVGRFIGKGLLTNTGSDWLRQRRLIQPGFHRSRLEALTGIMQRVIDEELDQLAIKAKAANEAIDIYPLTLGIAFRIIANAIYSDDIEEAELEYFNHLITSIQEYAIQEVRMPFLAWYFALSGKRRRHFKMAEEAQDFHRKLIEKRRDSGQERDDLIQMLLDARYEDTGEGMTDQQLMDEAAILFLAGHETSANTLAWTMYLLAKHPEVNAKVLKELETIAPGRSPKFEELRQLPYLTQVINESMRLYPPAWITDRVALNDDEVNGVPIPKGTLLTLFIYGLHHQNSQWEEPEMFRPERFTPENNKSRPAFSYLPFGGGPRLCIGNSFAMMEMQLVLAAVVRRFHLRLPPDYVALSKPLITLRPADGILMYLHENE